LEQTIKFIKRFQYLEGKTGELGKPLMDILAEMDVFFGKRGEASGKKKRNKKIFNFSNTQIMKRRSF
jgi:hypothetical protein